MLFARGAAIKAALAGDGRKQVWLIEKLGENGLSVRQSELSALLSGRRGATSAGAAKAERVLSESERILGLK